MKFLNKRSEFQKTKNVNFCNISSLHTRILLNQRLNIREYILIIIKYINLYYIHKNIIQFFLFKITNIMINKKNMLLVILVNCLFLTGCKSSDIINSTWADEPPH